MRLQNFTETEILFSYGSKFINTNMWDFNRYIVSDFILLNYFFSLIVLYILSEKLNPYWFALQNVQY